MQSPERDHSPFQRMKVGYISDIYKHEKWHLLKLSCELRRVQHLILITSLGLPILKAFLDRYFYNAITSDHLLAGLGSYFIELCSMKLQSDNTQIFDM